MISLQNVMEKIINEIMTLFLFNILKLLSSIFYSPVFRQDVLWYGDVRPPVRPSVYPFVHPGLRPGLRPSVTVFCTFLLHALTY